MYPCGYRQYILRFSSGYLFFPRWFLAQNLNFQRTKTPLGSTIHGQTQSFLLSLGHYDSILHAHEEVCSPIINKLSFWVLMPIPEWRIKLGSYRSQMSDANFVPQRCCCVVRVFFTINFNASDSILILTNLSSSHGDRFKSLQYPFNLNVVLENPIIA